MSPTQKRKKLKIKVGEDLSDTKSLDIDKLIKYGKLSVYNEEIPFCYLEDRFVGYSIKKVGLWEPWSAHFFVKTCSKLVKDNTFPEDFIFLDIGAHWGMYSVICGHFFPKAKIHAFEPIDYNFYLLRKNTEQYNVASWNCAVMDYNKDDDIIYAKGKNTGGAALKILPNPDETIYEVKCNTKTIDSFNIDFSRVCAVKIDVEGRDHILLEEISKLAHKNTLVFAEDHGPDGEEKIDKIVAKYKWKVIAKEEHNTFALKK